MTINNKKAVLLLSGGLDSATTGAIAKSTGYNLYALSMQYGQRHAAEVEAARKVAKFLNAVEHKVAELDLRLFGGSALTDTIHVPKDRSAEDMTHGIPVTYVPARNTIFLSYALAYAEVLNAIDIFIGVNAVDYSGYPDCRPTFIEAFEHMANLATAMTTEKGRKVTIHAPLVRMSKAEIIRIGVSLGLDYSLTFSCYDPAPAGRACGTCDSCILRKKGFFEAGIPDPTRYA